jgi:hypothetical protein
MHKVVTSSLLVAMLVGCGRATTETDVRLVNVGTNPDQIGPIPDSYGGFIDYYWLNFAGGGLNMGMSGLFVGYGDLGMAFDMGFRPPLALVAGFSYLFDAQLAGVDKLGIVPDPPVALDACHTLIRPQGPIGYFSTTDAGTALTLQGIDDDAKDANFVMSRDPQEYPPDPQDVAAIYLAANSWLPSPLYGRVYSGSDNPLDMLEKPARYANFPFGRRMALSFPGGLAPFPAPVATLPLPSATVGDPVIWVPNRQQGIRLSWQGPRYDLVGADISSGTDPQATCMQFYWPTDTKSAPNNAYDCAADQTYPKGFGTNINVYPGQIYTGPWDAVDGKLNFEWTIPESAATTGEEVSITVKFLGPIDRQYNDYIRSRMVNYADPSNPALGRSAMTCEPGEWVLDPSFYQDPENPTEGAPLAASLWGDPLDVVSEVSCRVQDDGAFTLTTGMVAEAVEYARKAGAEGAVFYFTRATRTKGETPAVKDYYDQRREVSPILINARTVELGRFLFNAE